MLSIKAKERKELAKQNKELRIGKMIPAVIYGPKRKSTNIQVGYKNFEKLFKEAKYSEMLDLDLEGKTSKALIREVQYDATGDNIIHVSFYEVDLSKVITAEVPVVSKGESKAVKENIGFLVLPFDTLTIRCLPANLPKEIVVNISNLNEVGDNLLLREYKLPEGVTLDASVDQNSALAYISPPQKEIVEEVKPAVEEEGAEEGVEGEEGEEAPSKEGEEAKESGEEKPKDKEKEKGK